MTQEANEEAAALLRSARNLLDSSGRLVRTLKGEGILSLYSLTRR